MHSILALWPGHSFNDDNHCDLTPMLGDAWAHGLGLSPMRWHTTCMAGRSVASPWAIVLVRALRSPAFPSWAPEAHGVPCHMRNERLSRGTCTNGCHLEPPQATTLEWHLS